MTTQILNLTDNPAIAGRADRYVTLKVDAARILANWRQSLMAHEWLTKEGHIRETDDLNMLDRDKVLKFEKALKAGQPLPRPVLGIGIFDNIEIGAGRDVFCVLVRAGFRVIEVHIPRSNQSEFNSFLG